MTDPAAAAAATTGNGHRAIAGEETAVTASTAGIGNEIAAATATAKATGETVTVDQALD